MGDLEESIGEGLVFGFVIGPELHGAVIALRVGKGDEKSLATKKWMVGRQWVIWKLLSCSRLRLASIMALGLLKLMP